MEVANSEFWYLVERIFDFVLCFEIDSGSIIKKKGFDEVCLELDSHTNYYDLMQVYKETYISELSSEEFTEKTSSEYIFKNDYIDFDGLEIIENQELRWYKYKIVTKANVGIIVIEDI